MTCSAGYWERCIGLDSNAIKDVQTLTQGATTLLEVCDSPNLHAKAVLVMACAHNLTADNDTLSDISSSAVTGLALLLRNSAFPDVNRDSRPYLTIVRSVQALHHMCCTIQANSSRNQVKAIMLCSSEARDVIGRIKMAMWTAYGCQARLPSSLAAYFGRLIAADPVTGCDPTVCLPAFNFFTDLTAKLNDPALREDHVEALCREGESLKDCQAYFNKCIPKSVPDVHEVLRGSIQLHSICARDTSGQLLTLLQRMNVCDKKVNETTPIFQSCSNALSDALGRLASAYDGDVDSLPILKTGTSLLQLCCAFKTYDTCLGKTPEELCGVKDATPNRNMLNSIYTAFDCEKKFAACSAAQA
ncbi:hypothetical protein BV898_04187 [Hypsibius exemplaris]|uniref:Uncharacterized protein n=1 Tax=Hypsibius exemplaris TaxID=2072580 RepID=A0A1W0X3A8_HYPEX|nr:hypothetical protein BV898_04187 [Hypsibius exemplaris]